LRMIHPGPVQAIRKRPQRGDPAARCAALFVAGLFAAGLLAGCDASPGQPRATHVEAWQADVPARFSFPPVGLEEFALSRKEPGSLELVIHIGADGELERLAAQRVTGFDQAALEALFTAIRHARFTPAIVDGQPVASIKRIAFDIDPLAGRFVATASTPDAAH